MRPVSTDGLPVDTVLHDAGSTNLDPEPENEPSVRNGRRLLKAHY